MSTSRLRGGVGLVDERADRHDPGVVDQHVERAELALDLVQERGEARRGRSRRAAGRSCPDPSSRAPVRSASGASMSPIATRAPWAISAAAVARPIPRPPPVIATTCTMQRSQLSLPLTVLLVVVTPNGSGRNRPSALLAGWPDQLQGILGSMAYFRLRRPQARLHDPRQGTAHHDPDAGPAALAEDADAAGRELAAHGNRVSRSTSSATATSDRPREMCALLDARVRPPGGRAARPPRARPGGRGRHLAGRQRHARGGRRWRPSGCAG